MMEFVNVVKDLVIIVGVPVFRSAAGWATKALEDYQITRFELKKLCATIMRVGSLGLIGYLGLSIGGIDNAAIAAAIGSFFADKLFKALKENKNVTKR